jgi:hypothetical protein
MPTRPEDLVRGVVDALAPPADHDILPGELRVLKTCTFVSKAFYITALPHVFREVSAQSLSQCLQLLDVIAHHKELNTYIRKVFISQIKSLAPRMAAGYRAPDGPNSPGWPSLMSLHQLITSPPVLQTLSFWDVTLGPLEVVDLTPASSECVVRVSNLQLDSCPWISMHVFAHLLEYMAPFVLSLTCTMVEQDISPPSWTGAKLSGDRTKPKA